MSAISGVQPSAGGNVTAGIDSQTIAGNFQLFLQLLTTQLRNQDPTSPLDTNQFTQQLVQFASVEQQLKTNSNLDALVSLNKTSQTTSALSFVGAQVTADGATTELRDGFAAWNVTSPRPATATLTVTDVDGNVVWTDKQTIDTGIQTYVWNGKMSNGLMAPDGSYTIQVTAKDATGADVLTSTEFTGTVSGVDLSGSQPLLQIGSSYLTISQVHAIHQSAAPAAPAI